jgi:hypothetical protein
MFYNYAEAVPGLLLQQSPVAAFQAIPVDGAQMKP